MSKGLLLHNSLSFNPVIKTTPNNIFCVNALQIEKRDNQNALVLPLLFVFIIIVDCCSRSQQICQSIAQS